MSSCKELAAADKLDRCDGSTAVVIGSGAIGIEAAEALKKRGCTVTVIELLDWTLFDPETARRLETYMEGYGMRVLTAEKVLRRDCRPSGNAGRRSSGPVRPTPGPPARSAS